MDTTQAPDAAMKMTRDKFKGAKVDWGAAFPVWGQWWEIHVYGFATCFCILFVWCLVHAIKAGFKKHIPHRPYYVILNVFVAVCSFGRTFYLLTLTYGTQTLVPKMLGLIPKYAMFPCITSSFILLFKLVNLQTKASILWEPLFTPCRMGFFIVANFVLAYTVDILAEFIHHGAYFYFICDVYFVCWGIFSSLAFWWIFYRFSQRVKTNRKKLNLHDDADNLSTESGYSHGDSHSLDTRIPTAAKITVVAGLAFFAIGVINIYKFIVMGINFHKDSLPAANPWTWWLYNFFFRLFELVMNVMIAWVGCLCCYTTRRYRGASKRQQLVNGDSVPVRYTHM